MRPLSPLVTRRSDLRGLDPNGKASLRNETFDHMLEYDLAFSFTDQRVIPNTRYVYAITTFPETPGARGWVSYEAVIATTDARMESVEAAIEGDRDKRLEPFDIDDTEGLRRRGP